MAKKKNNNFNFNTEATYNLNIPDVCSGYIEYKMPRTMAEFIMGDLKGKKHPQEVLCDYVNTQLDLKGYCVKVIVELN